MAGATLQSGLIRPFAQKLIEQLGARSPHAFAVALPDGTRHASGAGEPAFTLVLRSDAALLATLTRGHVGLLESHFDGEIDVEGSLNAAFATGLMAQMDPRFNPIDPLQNNLLEWRQSKRSLEQAKANARAHYGLPASFYRLWLDDPLMMYTCAYWREGTTTLEQARANKIDHVCRKLRLRPGECFALYPLRPGMLYLNFGFWDVVHSRKAHAPGHFNRRVEQQVMALGGIKSLYSDSFFSREDFDRAYGMQAYAALKARYDPQRRLLGLYEKCVMRV